MINLLQALVQLFDDHAPETLMALFGTGTSILLLYIVWSMLRHWFGLQTFAAGQDVEQEQGTTAIMEALVNALVSEAAHLRVTMDNILRESIQRSDANAELLVELSAKTDAVSTEVANLLKPEFEYLHHEMRQTETRLMSKILGVTYANDEKPASASETPGPEVIAQASD